jgi:hypothetical protein
MIDKQIQRLYNEWKAHDNIVIGVDFDDTIFNHNNIIDQEKVINLLKKAKTFNATIVIITDSNEDRYPEIYDYCNKKGLNINYINSPSINPYNTSNKIFANIYLDDRGGINEACEILSCTMYALATDYNLDRLATLPELG